MLNIDEMLRQQVANDKASILAQVLADNGLDTPDLIDALRHDADERRVPHDEDEYR